MPLIPKSSLRTYQHRVIKEFYERDAVLGVLKMGAGKTISALTAVQELKRDGHIRHALVIAPKRVAEMVWKQEAAKWSHTASLQVEVLTGSPRDRWAKLATAASRDVTVCGIDNLVWLLEQISEWPADHAIFDLIILDETSKFKDPKSKRGAQMRKVTSCFKIRWGLTGTPRPNSLMDLWGPMTILAPGIWPRSFYKWQRENFYATDYQGYYWNVLPGHDTTIMDEAAVYSVMLGEGEMPDLPPISVVEEEVELPPDARSAYDTMEAQLFAEHERGAVVAMSAAIATGKLAQAANGYFYGEGGQHDVRPLHDTKQEWLSEKLESLGDEPAILVYEFVEDRKMIRSILPGIPCLGGDITDKAAREAIDGWNARKLKYLAMHPASAGHGLNLQPGGSRMLWISPPWSAELWDQALARLHRPGQAEHVMVHVCIARNTVDEMKRDRVIGKMAAQAAFEKYLQRHGHSPKQAAE
jgi:SNF2 domain-containing protein